MNRDCDEILEKARALQAKIEQYKDIRLFSKVKLKVDKVQSWCNTLLAADSKPPANGQASAPAPVDEDAIRQAITANTVKRDALRDKLEDMKRDEAVLKNNARRVDDPNAARQAQAAVDRLAIQKSDCEKELASVATIILELNMKLKRPVILVLNNDKEIRCKSVVKSNTEYVYTTEDGQVGHYSLDEVKEVVRSAKTTEQPKESPK